MCQLNTEPMLTQEGVVTVVGESDGDGAHADTGGTVVGGSQMGAVGC